MIKQYRKVIEHEIEVDENEICRKCEKVIQSYNAHLPHCGGGLTVEDIFEEVYFTDEINVKIDGEEWPIGQIEMYFSDDLYDTVYNIIYDLIFTKYEKGE